MDNRFAAGAMIAAIVLLASCAFIITHNAGGGDDDWKVGVMWRPNSEAESYVYTCRSVEAAGGDLVRIGQVFSYDLSYDDRGKLIEGIDEIGFLDTEAAEVVKNSDWHDSNVTEMLKDVDIVIFPGGDDISPTLYRNPQEWVDTGEDRSFEPERDVSDYIAMSYCLDNDIPVVGICRGMQVLAVVSGADMIQDIGEYLAGMSIEYNYEHRNQRPSPGAYRDFAPHDTVIEEDSVIYGIMKKETLTGCPSWHHQAVGSVEGTDLRVTGTTYTDGVDIIESVERTDKKCAFGIQYHPEAAVCKHLDDLPNKDDFMSYEDSIALFEWIVDYRRPLRTDEPCPGPAP